MSTTTKNSPAAYSYAQALLDLANQRQQAAPIGQEMAQIGEILAANKTFADFLRDPGVSEDERLAAIDRIFGGKVNPLVYNTLRVMNIKGRMGLLGQIADAYQDLLDEQSGKIEVDITVAQRLDAATLEQVRQRISAALRKDAVIHQYEDPNIIGGMILRIEDKLIDGSIKAQLNAMKKRLMTAVAK